MTDSITTENGASYLFKGDEAITAGMEPQDIENFRRWFQIAPTGGIRNAEMQIVMSGDCGVRDEAAMSYLFAGNRETGTYQGWVARPEERKGWYQKHNRRSPSRSHKTSMR